ncbi:Rho guanine nucleotide exchange factor scd1 [Zancudomyces culisetae]|uniref:Rho guanine nucleotide exchange factor scd1 n=1 Tax=Zancudomyces culisetae TaxID=1213189 RepID=A0A1R1PFD9_ZANCU|nr:Rho guanine nucleotide exchange factor scd1 [Zancudomyces culisetae]OMH80357.1 Rho guanine nucleotide exchange factor scd1 [Zancudomyces culisetae]|eukprot:OMH79639.1 Rho guanine nucleotide exchange factor scd1 [Zancudomyces culisetae]
MLIKPVQRICKYPILVREMLKFCKESEDSATKRDLELCLEVSSRIATRVNSAQTREANLVIVKNLQERILDWKGYSISTFGELQLHDQFLMSTSDSARELQLYLFDQILICCKEVTDSNKRKSTRQSNGNILAAQSPSSTSNLGLTPLQLKGRIFLYSISRVINSSRNNNLSLTVFWRDVFMENFSLKCRSEEQLNIWKTTMERLIDRSKAAQTTEKQVPEADLPPLPDVDSSQVDRYTSDDDLIRSRDFPDTRKTYDGSSSGLISTHKETRSFSTVSKYSAAGSNASGTDSMQFTMPYNTPPVPPMPSALSQRYTAPELATFKTSQGVRPFKVKIHYNEDMYILIVKTTISYSELLKKIEHKVRLCSDFQVLEDHTKGSHQSNGTTPNSGPDSPTLSLKIRYMDEDGDLVLVASDDDVMMAFESASLGSVLQSTPDKLRSASLMTTNSVISTTSTNSTSTIPTLNLYVSL